MNVDITIRHVGQRIRTEIGLFHHTLNGFIHRAPMAEPVVGIRSALPAFEYSQTNAQLLGGEASCFLQIAPHIRSSVSLSVVRGEDTESELPLVMIPPDHLRAYIEYAGPGAGRARDRWARIEVTAVARQNHFPEGFDSADPPEAYILLGLSAGTTLQLSRRKAGFAMEVRNLFNRTYQDYLSLYRYAADEPGVDVWLRLRIPFESS